jgi:hypothetical protein
MSSSESRRLKSVVTLRLHESDLYELQQEAESLGLTVGGLLREIGLDRSVRRHFLEKRTAAQSAPVLTRSA